MTYIRSLSTDISDTPHESIQRDNTVERLSRHLSKELSEEGLPRFAGCEWQGIPWFEERGLWQEAGYVPAPGDIIFFDWEGDGVSDHVGIVEYVEGETVHTIEGNTSDSCAQRSYSLTSASICGYGTPMY